jgi:cell pole-organizing protein PopZ
MKSFFNNDGCFNNKDGRDFSQQANKILKPFLKKWLDKGFSPSEIFDLLAGEIRITSSMYKLNAMSKVKE